MGMVCVHILKAQCISDLAESSAQYQTLRFAVRIVPVVQWPVDSLCVNWMLKEQHKTAVNLFDSSFPNTSLQI